MHVDLVRDKAKTFPEEAVPVAVTSLKVWHCGYKTIAPLRKFTELRHLVIATYPDDSFEHLACLNELERLEILHFPRVRSLAPLSTLQNLESLQLASLPSWDASSKRLVVDSLEPLAKLSRLRSLHLLGVVPPDKSLSSLEASLSLRFARFHGYSTAEQSRFFEATHVQLAPSEA